MPREPLSTRSYASTIGGVLLSASLLPGLAFGVDQPADSAGVAINLLGPSSAEVGDVFDIGVALTNTSREDGPPNPLPPGISASFVQVRRSP